MKLDGSFPLWYNKKETILYYTLKDNKIAQVFIKLEDIFDNTLAALVKPFIEEKILIENNYYISLPNILKVCRDDRAKLGPSLIKDCEKTVNSLEKIIIVKRNEIESELKKPKLFSLINKEEMILNEEGLLSSYIFSKKLNKKHEHIMSVIKKIKDNFGEEYFIQNFFPDKFEINNRFYPMYTMNKNGFIVLISQLNKLKGTENLIPFIIKHFDAYSKNIAIPIKTEESSYDTKKSCRNDRKLLNLLVNDCAKELGVDTFKIWEKIHNRFEINTITTCSVDMITKIERYAEMLLMEYKMQNMVKKISSNRAISQ